MWYTKKRREAIRIGFLDGKDRVMVPGAEDSLVGREVRSGIPLAAPRLDLLCAWAKLSASLFGEMCDFAL